MAKKEMKGEGHSCDCKGGVLHKVVMGIIVAVLGLLLIWPMGWFTFGHTFGLLVFLMGIKIISHSFRCCH